MQIHEMHIGEYTISTDGERIDVNVVYKYLHHEAYWSQGIPLDVVDRSIEPERHMERVMPASVLYNYTDETETRR